MATSENATYLTALGLGMLAGMRSMAAPALLSDHLQHASTPPLEGTPVQFLGTPGAAAALKLLAAGEMFADKTPFIPDRTSPIALGGRVLSGALVGAAVCAAAGRRAETGALIGVVGAVAATYGMYHLRRRLGEELSLPDPVLGVAEDLLVVAGGCALLRATDPGGPR